MELYVRVAIGGVLMPTLRAWMEYHFELGNLRISNYYCCLNLMFFLVFVVRPLEQYPVFEAMALEQKTYRPVVSQLVGWLQEVAFLAFLK